VAGSAGSSHAPGPPSHAVRQAQAAGDLAIEKHAVDAKSISGSVTWTAGTGKYAGITGIHRFVCDDAFRAAGEGTFFNHCTNNGSYKLP
jgi:hypothetical protein